MRSLINLGSYTFNKFQEQVSKKKKKTTEDILIFFFFFILKLKRLKPSEYFTPHSTLKATISLYITEYNFFGDVFQPEAGSWSRELNPGDDV